MLQSSIDRMDAIIVRLDITAAAAVATTAVALAIVCARGARMKSSSMRVSVQGADRQRLEAADQRIPLPCGGPMATTVDV